MSIPDSESKGRVAEGAFVTTHWSVVLAAGDSTNPGAAAALEDLCRIYWYPLYAYVRRSGHGREDSQDLTQEFFARFLEKKYFRRAVPERGRFRTFLLCSLKHFLVNEWHRATAVKRGGDCAFISWDEEEEKEHAQVETPAEWTAEKVYDRQWALTLLEQVTAQLQAECVAAGKGEMFDALRPYLSGEHASPSYAQVGTRLKLGVGGVQVAVHRLRRRYGELLRKEIAQTVSHPAEVDEELRYLFEALRT